MWSHLKTRRQNIINSASTTKTVAAGVLHGSVDGFLLFHTFIINLVLFMRSTKLGNYNDGNNISVNRSNKKNLKKLLLSNFKTLTEWFPGNYMIIDSDKCSYMCLGKNNNNNDTFSCNEFNLRNSKEETLLWIKIDRKINF